MSHEWHAVRAFIITVVLCFCLFSIAQACAPDAEAQTNDEQFITELEDAGIEVLNEAGLVDYAKWVCKGMTDFSVQPSTLTDLVATHHHFPLEAAEIFVAVSAEHYCPVVLEDTRTEIA